MPDGNFVSAYLPGGNVTLLRVQHPRAGTWTLTPDVGSPAIDNVRSAKALPALHVTARVKGRGRSRVLTWNARGLGGRTIRFTERAKDVGQTIVVTNKQRGHARYAIEDGAAGRRNDRGAGDDGRRRAGDRRPVVARYRAPGPPRPHKPGKLKIRRRHGTVTVRWARVKGADGYSIRVTGSDGRKEVHFLSRKHRKLRILTVAPPTRLKLRVAGWHGIRSIVGPARKATVRPQKAKKKHKKKKRKRGDPPTGGLRSPRRFARGPRWGGLSVCPRPIRSPEHPRASRSPPTASARASASPSAAAPPARAGRARSAPS